MSIPCPGGVESESMSSVASTQVEVLARIILIPVWPNACTCQVHLDGYGIIMSEVSTRLLLLTVTAIFSTGTPCNERQLL